MKLRKQLKKLIYRKAKRIKPAKKFPVCEQCGGVRHSIHHIKRLQDYNFTNKEMESIGFLHRAINTRENLIVLCEKCHKEEHTGFISKEDLIALGIFPGPIYNKIFRLQWKCNSKEEVIKKIARIAQFGRARNL